MMQTTLKSMFQKGLVETASELRYNQANNYPFITLYGPLGTTNLYFGKRSAERIIAASKVVGFKMLPHLAKENASVILATNADKNKRFKLSTSGDLKDDVSTRGEALAAFGIDADSIETVEVPFDWTLFKAEFGRTNTEETTANPINEKAAPSINKNAPAPVGP